MNSLLSLSRSKMCTSGMLRSVAQRSTSLCIPSGGSNINSISSSSSNENRQYRNNFHNYRSLATSTTPTSSAADTPSPTELSSTKQPKYWNREEYAASCKQGRYEYVIKISPESIVRHANIISLSDPDDDANRSLSENLPFGSSLLATGTSYSDFEHLIDGDNPQPNVLYVSPSCPKARKHLPILLKEFPSIEWVHVRSAGIDFVVSDTLSNHLSTLDALPAKTLPTVTNAKGQFSSSLSEYIMMACSYFAKDLPRLLRQKSESNWDKYDVHELRGKTMGIVGYGDIGRATAQLAHVYGMKIVALRRNPTLSSSDPLVDVVYGTDKESLNQLMSESDYVVCSAPSTVETRGMVNADAFAAVKPGAVFINVGRGPVVDEGAMIGALRDGRLRGAALDVFEVEPLPRSSELWELENVLISPHNMDQTSTFMHEAAEFFVYENLPRYILGKTLLNPVDPRAGY